MKKSDSLGAITVNSKILAWPILLLIGLILLFVFVLQVGVRQVFVLKDKTEKSKEEEAVLGKKLDVLSTLEESALPLADLSLVALPETNPSLVIISQLKSLALEKGVNVVSIEQAAPIVGVEGQEVTYLMVQFNINGEIIPILEYLKALKTSVPLITLGDVQIVSEIGLNRAKVGLVGNFSALPATLPALTSPLNELTAEEKDILAKLSSYKLPVFSEVPPSGPYERADLFNF